MVDLEVVIFLPSLGENFSSFLGNKSYVSYISQGSPEE